MPRNGSGTYSLPAGNPVVTGTTISSTTQNNTMSDVATEITNSVPRDGQAPPTANLPMGGYKHTGVADSSALDQYASAKQVQNGLCYLASVSGTNTITASVTPAATAYANGQTFRFAAAGANTGAVTININSIGAKSITKNGASALAAGDIPSGAVIEITYDGTQFQMIGVVSDRLPSTGGTLTGDLTMSASSIFESEGAAVASASSTNIWAGDGNTVHITGNATINDFGTAPQAGAWMKVIFDGTPTLTQSANLNLNAGGSNITIAVDDVAFVYADTTTQIDVFVIRKSGAAIAASAAATAAEIRTGTDNAKFTTPLGIFTALGFSNYFSSTAQTITAAGTLTIAHGFGRKPAYVWAVLKCTSTEFGYAVNDEIFRPVGTEDLGGVDGYGCEVIADGTNLYIRFGSGATTFRAINFTTGQAGGLTNAKWQVIFRAIG